MTVPIFIPFVYFSHALNKVWRRHMLVKHGLNPALIDELFAQEERRTSIRPTPSATGRATARAAAAAHLISRRLGLEGAQREREGGPGGSPP